MYSRLEWENGVRIGEYYTYSCIIDCLSIIICGNEHRSSLRIEYLFAQCACVLFTHLGRRFPSWAARSQIAVPRKKDKQHFPPCCEYFYFDSLFQSGFAVQLKFRSKLHKNRTKLYRKPAKFLFLFTVCMIKHWILADIQSFFSVLLLFWYNFFQHWFSFRRLQKIIKLNISSLLHKLV